MIIIKADKNDIQAAHIVAKNVELASVFLTKSACINPYVEQNNNKLRLEVNESFGRYKISAKNTLVVFCGIKIVEHKVKEENTNKERNLDTSDSFTIDVEYAMEFLTPKGEIPNEIKEKGFPAFAKINGPYICMPYIRQAVQYLASQMNLNNLVLPTLMIKEIVEKPKQ